MNLSREQQNELLFVGFNQDSGINIIRCKLRYDLYYNVCS